MQYKVSFIIPFFNAGASIQETLDSILNQTYPNYDIWIINDGSTDEASLKKLAELEKRERIKVIHQVNSGPGIARNSAIQKTDAEIIVPLDADDLICTHTLEKAIPQLMADTGIGIVYGDLEFFGAKNEIKKQVDFSYERQFIFNQVAVCACIRKEVFETCGYYDEFLSKPGLEDWEFWIRVGQSKWVFKKRNEVFFKVRVDENSRTFQVANKNLDMIKEYVYKKHATHLSISYENLYYEAKMLRETPDYRIGNRILKPWRLIKKWLRK